MFCFLLLALLRLLVVFLAEAGAGEGEEVGDEAWALPVTDWIDADYRPQMTARRQDQVR